MEKLNKSLIAITLFSVLFGIAVLWDKNFSSPSPPITADCGCYCNKLHEKEEKKMLSQIREDRVLLREERARESDKIMKEQEEYCSKLFRDYLELYGKDK